MSDLRRNWLKTYYRVLLEGKDAAKADKLVDRLEDNQIDELIEEIRKDLEEMANLVLELDEDFIEYLHELGYGGEEVDINEVAIEFNNWLKEEVNA